MENCDQLRVTGFERERDEQPTFSFAIEAVR
jgi:hypothetical protein